MFCPVDLNTVFFLSEKTYYGCFPGPQGYTKLRPCGLTNLCYVRQSLRPPTPLLAPRGWGEVAGGGMQSELCHRQDVHADEEPAVWVDIRCAHDRTAKANGYAYSHVKKAGKKPDVIRVAGAWLSKWKFNGKCHMVNAWSDI